MRVPRPGLPRPWRRGKATSQVELPPAGRADPDGDVRILRRTRLRLMAVSGVVTLFILVALGVATYSVVAAALNASDQSAFKSYTNRHLISQPSATGPETSELGGEGANVFEIDVTPAGVVRAPRGQTLPAGLPDQASLKAAAASKTGTDERSFTAPDGTPYYIMSVQAVGPSPGTWLIQFVQNRSAESRLLLTLFWILLGGGAVALLAALLAGYLYAGRALVPIRASMQRRQSALQRQREFAANASHELRTPLTVIGASVEDLKRNRRSKVEDVGEALGDIEAEVRHMTALVEDMLLLARTDSGVVQLDRVSLDMGDIAAEAASTLTALGQERGVKVVLDTTPAPISGDPLRLRQLVTIVVDNAIRHSPAGSTVSVWVRSESGGALLQVDDQGPGIKPEDLPRLFERFWRADNAPAGGTGLGLAIAKWIVDQHGGSIGVFNRPEGGASFWARLPSVPVRGEAADDGPWTAATTEGPLEPESPGDSDAPGDPLARGGEGPGGPAGV